MVKRKRKKDSLSVKIFILPALLIFVLTTVAIFRQVIKMHQMNRDIKIVEEEIKKIEEVNSSVLDNLDHYKTVNFLEEEARLKMGMKKNGEQVAVILEKKNSEKKDVFSSEDSKVEGRVNNPQKWFYYFFRKDLL